MLARPAQPVIGRAAAQGGFRVGRGRVPCLGRQLRLLRAGIALWGPAALREGAGGGGGGLQLLGREGGLEGHGVECAELLRVKLLAETRASVGEPYLKINKNIISIKLQEL